ncbi:MAG: hypothetical protein RMY34_24150, partial [Aulosira sp. DedQUE10]|nr:hypothetical protein [Aulosira sp. DedQUE10]
NSTTKRPTSSYSYFGNGIACGQSFNSALSTFNSALFIPPLNPLPLARGGEVLRQQSRGGV